MRLLAQAWEKKMGLFCLTEEQAKAFEIEPEIVMGLHVARVEPSKGERELALVLGGSVLLTYDGDLPSDLERSAAELWFLHSRDPETGPIPASVMEQFELWKTGLGGRSVQPLSDRGALSMIAAYTLPLPPTAPPPPPRPLVVFGHLPFSGSTGVGESYFRFEPWPTSRRINQPTSGGVLAGTYTVPRSELPFLPTGFAAVARCALPNLLPACFKWELQPPSNTPFRCGASVPLYGQAGGGVEVEFPSAFGDVRGAVPAPNIIPAL
jgi:hypothetical protein